ncbi:MAG: FKBP-type peptidyl-prolyl cis-trans isomerase [Ignavibacteria bacterium]|nr:FKBP-type peptidyl-prolyl cis-trans isomerase [Ignavibacteria bacterium]MBI3765580.1 FKBP-type peptidyl-prolyl cis-trans isomerase [Ignavibacteriales bacterium]
MKYVWTAVLCLGLIACQGNTQDKAQLKTQKDSVSYSIGMDIGRSLKKQLVDVDVDVLAQGMKAMVAGGKQILSDSMAQVCMMAFQKQMMAKQEEHMKAELEKNKKEGETFLSENKKKEGVVTLPDGLQYKVQKMGEGKKPKDTDKVSVHYRGTLIDGTEFDSSIKRGQPAEFACNGVIKGWTEALQLMPVGSKWTLYIPAELGYGERGAGQAVPPNATLIFDVELLAIK